MAVMIHKPNGTVRVNSEQPIGMRVLEREEMHAAIRYWIGQGYSDLATALKVGCSDRTVLRYRQRKGLPANYSTRKGS